MMSHEKKIEWMAVWAARNGVQLDLEGSCGIGRECVGIIKNGKYPDYKWGGPFSDEEEDQNGDVWTPEDAYHKHECVAVLGRGENAESQLYEWLQWFDREGFKVTYDIDQNVSDPVRLILGKQHVVRIERKGSS